MEVLVPISLFISIALVIVGNYYFRYLTRKVVQETIHGALAQGQNLSQELIQALAASTNTPNADLRRGLFSIAIAGAIAILSISIGKEEAYGPLLGIASFPLLIGLVYVGLWRFGANRSN